MPILAARSNDAVFITSANGGREQKEPSPILSSALVDREANHASAAGLQLGALRALRRAFGTLVGKIFKRATASQIMYHSDEPKNVREEHYDEDVPHTDIMNHVLGHSEEAKSKGVDKFLEKRLGTDSRAPKLLATARYLKLKTDGTAICGAWSGGLDDIDNDFLFDELDFDPRTHKDTKAVVREYDRQEAKLQKLAGQVSKLVGFTVPTHAGRGATFSVQRLRKEAAGAGNKILDEYERAREVYTRKRRAMLRRLRDVNRRMIRDFDEDQLPRAFVKQAIDDLLNAPPAILTGIVADKREIPKDETAEEKQQREQNEGEEAVVRVLEVMLGCAQGEKPFIRPSPLIVKRPLHPTATSGLGLSTSHRKGKSRKTRSNAGLASGDDDEEDDGDDEDEEEDDVDDGFAERSCGTETMELDTSDGSPDQKASGSLLASDDDDADDDDEEENASSDADDAPVASASRDDEHDDGDDGLADDEDGEGEEDEDNWGGEDEDDWEDEYDED